MKPYLSVIIPTYNEAKRLPLTLIDIDRHLSKMEFPSAGSGQAYEIIVVDNNSTDATPELVERFSHLIKNLRLIKMNGRGKGIAVKTGMLEAKGEIRLFTDADNSTSIDQFNKMIPYFPARGGSAAGGKKLEADKRGKEDLEADSRGYDIVIGSRDVEGAKLIPAQPWHKRLGGNLGNLVIQLLLLPGMWDTQCGFKAFTEEAARKIFPLIKIERWGFDVEVLSLAKKFGYKIKEIPVVWVNDPFSRVKLTTYFQFLIEVLKIKWWMMNFDKNYKTKSQ